MLSELWTLTDATKFDEIMTSRQISFFRTFHQVVLKFITTDFFLISVFARDFEILFYDFYRPC